MDALKKAIKELDREMYVQVGIIYGSAAIAFNRYWGYGCERIKRIFEITEDTWEECGEQDNVSMLQMLEDETGIEMKLAENGTSYHDLDFLNGKIPYRRLNRAQTIYMRSRQKPWISALVMSALLLGLHRREGFGQERLARLMGQINEIREEYHYSQKEIVNEAYIQTGVKITGLLFPKDENKDCEVKLV